MTESYKKALEDALAEHRALVTQRTEVDQRIAQLRETIITLLRLLGQKDLDFESLFESAELAQAFDPKAEVGLSEAVIEVLKGAERFLTVREIRERLGNIGFDIERYAKALPSITTTLSRLVRSGDALRQEVDGISVYKWNTSPFKHSPLKYIGQRARGNAPAWVQRLKEASEKSK